MGFKKIQEFPTIDVSLVTVETKETPPREIAFDTASQISVAIQTDTQEATTLIVKGVLKAQKGKEVTITGNTITLTDNVFAPELVQILQGGTIYREKKYTYVEDDTITAGNYSISLGNGTYANFALAAGLNADDTLEYSDFTNVVTVTASGVTTEIKAELSSAQAGTVIAATATETDKITGYDPPVSGKKQDRTFFTLNVYSAIYNNAAELQGYECTTFPNCYGDPITFNAQDGTFSAPSYTINSSPDIGQAPYNIKIVKDLPNLIEIL